MGCIILHSYQQGIKDVRLFCVMWKCGHVPQTVQHNSEPWVGVAQWQSFYLACPESWVWSLALENGTRKPSVNCRLAQWYVTLSLLIVTHGLLNGRGGGGISGRASVHAWKKRCMGSPSFLLKFCLNLKLFWKIELTFKTCGSIKAVSFSALDAKTQK